MFTFLVTQSLRNRVLILALALVLVVFGGYAVDHDQGLQRRVLAGLGIEPRGKLGLRNRYRRAGVREIELQQIRRR